MWSVDRFNDSQIDGPIERNWPNRWTTLDNKSQLAVYQKCGGLPCVRAAIEYPQTCLVALSNDFLRSRCVMHQMDVLRKSTALWSNLRSLGHRSVDVGVENCNDIKQKKQQNRVLWEPNPVHGPISHVWKSH